MKKLKKYILKRLLGLPAIIFGVTFLSFGLLQFAATDTVDMMYDEAGGATEEVKAEKRRQLGLDQPFLVQYGHWLGAMVTGDLGTSFVSGRPVLATLADKFPTTFLLMAASLSLTAAVALPLGLFAAKKQDRPPDYVIRLLCFMASSTPNFYMGLLVLYFLSLKLGLFPSLPQSGDLRGLVMPSLTLALSMVAKYTRLIRAAVLEEYFKDYVVGARCRGRGELAILTGEVLPNILPMLVTMSALSVGSLLGGTMAVEVIFSVDGVGKLAVESIAMRDYPLVGAYIVFLTVIYTLVNLMADVLYHYLDPRVNYEEEKG